MPALRYVFGLLVCAILSSGFAYAEAKPVLIFAASSLKNALDEVASIAAVSTRISYAASSALAKQIESGAPADIFISADLDWMAYLDKANLIRKNSVTPLLGNTLVLISPAANAAKADIKPGMDIVALLYGGKLAMADVVSVPAGRYGKAALESLGQWDKVLSSVVQSENVRAALKLVALNEARLGIVYGSDAVADKTVNIVGVFPESSYPKIIYPAGLVMTSSNPDAQAFLSLLKSQDAATIFVKHGFTVLAP